MTVNIINIVEHSNEYPFANVTLYDGPDISKINAPPLQIWEPLNHGSYQRNYLENQKIECRDPITNDLIEADYSYIFFMNPVGIVYKFSGKKTFYLLSSSWEQSKLGIFIPETNTLLVTGMWPNLTNKVLRKLIEAIANDNDIKLDLNLKPVIFLGFGNNLGHFIWNELSGIESLINASILSRVSEIRIGAREFLPISDIFPEIRKYDIKIVKHKNSDKVCKFHFALRVTDTRISLGLRKRLMAFSLVNVSPQWILRLKNNKSKIILINLRKHNKSWIDQSLHISKLIKKINSIHGLNTLYIFDGVADTNDFVEEIYNFYPDINYINATDVSLADSIYLNMSIDFFISVVGSGLVIPNWIVGRRGIAHSNTAHLAQKAWWNNISEGIRDVRFIERKYITDSTDLPHAKKSYVNYELDFDYLSSTVLDLLDQCDHKLRFSLFAKMMDIFTNTRSANLAVDMMFKI